MAEQEDLEDLLADVPDLSVREAEEALRAAGKSSSLEEIVAVLEEADEALKELQTDVKAMRRRNDKARGMDAAMRKARAAADKQAAKAVAKPARTVRREDTLAAFIAEASTLSVAAAETELVAAESADSMTELDQHLGRAEMKIAALLFTMKPLRKRAEKAYEAAEQAAADEEERREDAEAERSYRERFGGDDDDEEEEDEEEDEEESD